MGQLDEVKRQKMNRRVEFVRIEGKGPGAKKSFTLLYGISRVHGVRGMALNAGWSRRTIVDWSSFGTKYIILKLGGMC